MGTFGVNRVVFRENTLKTKKNGNVNKKQRTACYDPQAALQTLTSGAAFWGHLGGGTQKHQGRQKGVWDHK